MNVLCIFMCFSIVFLDCIVHNHVLLLQDFFMINELITPEIEKVGYSLTALFMKKCKVQSSIM